MTRGLTLHRGFGPLFALAAQCWPRLVVTERGEIHKTPTVPITSLSLGVTLLVLVAGLLHATWNAIAKSFHDQWVSFTLINIGVAIPCVIALPILGFPRSASWGYLAAAVCCHLVYELFLMTAYRHGSLSQSYPIARGVSPMLTTLGGLVFASESVNGRALSGIVLVVIGIASLALLDRRSASRRGVAWAMLTGVMIATYTVVDGLGVRASHDAVKYATTLFAFQAVIFVAGAYLRRPEKLDVTPRRVVLGVLAGVLSLLGYGTVLWAQVRAPLGVVSALRETGVIWATLMGILFFKEKGGWRLVLASSVVLGGVTMIALSS